MKKLEIRGLIMTPKQKLKKLKAKAQFKKLDSGNAHRDKWGKMQNDFDDYIHKKKVKARKKALLG